MSIDTSTWGWPQWAILVLLLLSLTITASHHGKERLIWSGPDKGSPERYNGFLGVVRFGVWLFLLSAGGFFS